MTLSGVFTIITILASMYLIKVTVEKTIRDESKKNKCCGGGCHNEDI